jgi:K+-sensing histidine kinase KdpD
MPNYSNNSYSNLIELSEHVASSWLTNHPNYNVSFVSPAQLSSLASQFRATRLQSSLKTTSKRANTNVLAAVNKRIETATTMLKRLIKALYPIQKNYDDLFSMYGFKSETAKSKTNDSTVPTDTNVAAEVPDTNPTATDEGKKKRKQKPVAKLPIDNDDRIAAMRVLINKLEEPNNILAAQEYGLAAWRLLLSELQAAWADSRTLKSARTVPVRATAEQSKELKSILSRLRMQINIDFHGANINQVYREFGFLKEI